MTKAAKAAPVFMLFLSLGFNTGPEARTERLALTRSIMLLLNRTDPYSSDPAQWQPVYAGALPAAGSALPC